MEEEVLRPDSLVADSGTILSFSGGTFDIADLGDEDGNTGLTIGSNGASIDFSMSNPIASNIDNSLQTNTRVLAVGIVTAHTVHATNIEGTIVAPGSDTQILFNDGGTVGASADFTFDDSTNILDVNGSALIGNALSSPVGNAKLSIKHSAAGFTTAIAFANNTGDGSKIISARSLVLGADYDANNSQEGRSHIAFETDGTEKVRIRNDGRVGIGTTIPDQTFHVHKGSAGIIASDSNAVITAENDDHSIIQILSPTNKSGRIMFGDENDQNAGQISYDHDNDDLSFVVNGSEKVRFNSFGNVGIGTDDPSGTNALTNNNSKLAVGIITANSGKITNNLIVMGSIGVKNTDPQYDLHVTGTAAATNFDSLSDRKVKTNIQVIQNPIDKIKKIDGVSFNWKSDNRPSLGVIADNVEEILPEIVSGNDPKSVNYNGLIGLLIEVVKDQQKQIDELRGLLDK